MLLNGNSPDRRSTGGLALTEQRPDLTLQTADLFLTEADLIEEFH